MEDQQKYETQEPLLTLEITEPELKIVGTKYRPGEDHPLTITVELPDEIQYVYKWDRMKS